jgi:hypothetical protein
MGGREEVEGMWVGGMWCAVLKGIRFWYSSTFNPQHMKLCDENIWMYVNIR